MRFSSSPNIALGLIAIGPKSGFQVYENAKLQRWQEAVRDRQVARLEALEEVKTV